MTSDPLWTRARAVAGLMRVPPMRQEMSAEQIYQTMHARPTWNRSKWVKAVEIAAEELIDEGYTSLEAISKVPNKVYAPYQRESVGWNGGAGIERCPMETDTALVASA